MFFASPILFRALPFSVYILFLAFNDLLLQMLAPVLGDVRWLYAIRIFVVVILLGWFWREYSELNKAASLNYSAFLISILVGVIVFVLWVLPYPSWAATSDTVGFNPTNQAGNGFDVALTLIRLSGAALVVPIMEELFWRSLIMRWLQHQNFLQVNPVSVGMFAFVATAALFAVEHNLWLAGLIAGLAYGWLYRKEGNLWMPVIAHMVTNAMLGVWVIYTNNWHYW